MPLSNADKLLDKSKLNFGKHRGKTPREVAAIDPDYVVWMYMEVKPTPCSRDLFLTCSEAPEYDEPGDLESWARDIAADW